MFLDSPTRKLVVVLNAAAIIKDMPVIVDYVDITATTTTPAPGYARTSGTTPVDILVGPTAGTQRKVNGLTIYNSDTAVKTVKVYTVDNPVGAAALTGGFEYQIISLGTTDFTLVGAASNTVGVIFVPTGPGAGTGTASPVYPAIDVTLQVDDTLGYTDVNGWYALDMSGNLKTVVGTSASAIADAINTAPVKTTPVGADKIGIWNSVTGLLNSVAFTDALSWFAAKLGNAANVFSVAAATAAAHAVRKDQLDAATGHLGEVIESVAGFANAPTSGQYGDVTFIDITAGTWDVCTLLSSRANGATVTAIGLGVGTVAGNNATGATSGDTYVETAPPTSAHDGGGAVPTKRYVVAATTRLYLKTILFYSVATPLCAGRITAVRAAL